MASLAAILAIGPEHPNGTGLDRLKDYLKSKVTYRFGSVYDLNPAEYGHFDIVLFFGVLYHLIPEPTGADSYSFPTRR